MNLIGPVTTSLNCGVFRRDGTVDLRLHFDHRVLDGMTAARTLAELEEILTHNLVTELESLAEDGEITRASASRFAKSMK